VYLVIDALDECPSLGGNRKKVLDTLRRILLTTPDNPHVFCTSRREADIVTAIAPLLCPPSRSAIDLTARQHVVDADIARYIGQMLASGHYNSWPESIKLDVEQALMKKANGMYVPTLPRLQTERAKYLVMVL